MAKSQNQKLKLLYLMQIFLEQTDENHYVTLNDITRSLAANDIKVERKTVYADVDALIQYGMDIQEFSKAGKYYYHLVGRQFELSELKLLVDSVQSSKFITERKSNELIAKLESLTSKYEAQGLQRQVYVRQRIKTMNESIFYNVDDLHNAINMNRKISFDYYDWNLKKQLVKRPNGHKTNISPWALTWDDENYYLVAYDGAAERIKHYRVDKIRSLDISDEEREGKELFSGQNNAEYSKKMFGMFGGKEENVLIEFDNSLIGVAIDRFGKDIFVVPNGSDKFTVRVTVEVSNMFLAWIIGLGEGVKILEPENVVNMICEQGKRISETYSK